MYSFLKEATVLYATTALHFMEICPLKSPFDPSYMVKNQDKSIKGLGLLLERLLSLKRLPSSKYVEEAKKRCKIFVKDIVTLHFERFEEFHMFQQTVNKFMGSFLSDKKFSYVYDILKINYTLSHGQLSIERGFRINKEHLLENFLYFV